MLSWEVNYLSAGKQSPLSWKSKIRYRTHTGQIPESLEFNPLHILLLSQLLQYYHIIYAYVSQVASSLQICLTKILYSLRISFMRAARTANLALLYFILSL
jgi:hypothetical protein